MLPPDKWAYKHKKRIAREFIRNVSVVNANNPSGIFTAGLPGAGKTEFTIELINGIDPKPLRIDMDEIAQIIEGYSPKNADIFRGGASIILSKIYDEVMKSKMDFVFDGTLSSSNSLVNIERALYHGYKVKIYYIHQLPEIAWKFTKDRELVEHRAIEREGFKQTYFNLISNLRSLCNNYKDVTISLVIKDQKNKIGQLIENINSDIFEYLPDFLTEEQLDSAII